MSTGTRSRRGGPRAPAPAEDSRAPRDTPAAGRGRAALLLALPVALLTVLVQRRALGAYFTPDDLLQLERASGLVHWPVSAWRWLSGYAYAKLATGAFGADPWPYHAVNLGLLALAAALLFALARRLGASLPAAFVAAALFGASRVHFTALVATSWTSEFLSLALVLGALLVLDARPWRLLGACALMVAAVSAKESVLLLPGALLLAVPARERRPLLALVATGVVAGAWCIADGGGTGRFAGEAYATAFGPNMAAALFTLARWAVDVATPIPDALTSADPGAWASGLPVVLALAALAVLLRRRAPYAAAGAAWWLLGLLPVLPLLHQTHLHYLVAPAAGLSLVVAGALDAWLPRARGTEAPAARAPRLAWAVAALLVVGWAAAQERLLDARWTAVLPGGDAPADPVLRKSEYARRLIEGTRDALEGRRARVAFFLLDDTMGLHDLRTGATGALRSGEVRRNAVEAILGDGTALRALVPNVDSVLFVHELDSSLEGFDCFLPTRECHARYMGRPPEAFEVLAMNLVRAGLHEAAARMLEYEERMWPGRPRLLWMEAVALQRSGEHDRAMKVLRRLVRTAPDDPLAASARDALDSAAADAQVGQ